VPAGRSLAPLAAAFAPRQRQVSAPLWWVTFGEQTRVTFRECRRLGLRYLLQGGGPVDDRGYLVLLFLGGKHFVYQETLAVRSHGESCRWPPRAYAIMMAFQQRDSVLNTTDGPISSRSGGCGWWQRRFRKVLVKPLADTRGSESSSDPTSTREWELVYFRQQEDLPSQSGQVSNSSFWSPTRLAIDEVSC